MATKVRPTLSLHLINFAAEGHTGGWEHLFALARAADAAGVDIELRSGLYSPQIAIATRRASA